MDFTPQEKALIGIYLGKRPGPTKLWIALAVLGALVLVLGIVGLAQGGKDHVGVGLLVLVAGLVVMAQAMDMRNKSILAAIIQKYHKATEKQ